ncbi:N-6 DNA methylase [Nonomuraea sp. H19]|uniref:N-6 DNA methylase n=1 Tax=Nonomuraea sp. H19 TaxID=3452206 RepID=UPI003F897423
MMGNDVTVTSAEIARLAGIDRAVVSNWRRRYEDFPSPVAGTAASPLFSLDQIETWLRARGSKVRLSVEGRVWQQLRALGDDLRLSEVLTATGHFLRYLQTGHWVRLAQESDEVVEAEVAREIRKSPEGRIGFPAVLPPRTAPILRVVAELAEAQGAATLFEFFTGRFLEAHHRSFAATPPALAALMTRLVGEDVQTVFDPACGTGTLLVAATSPGRRVLGQELDPDLARLAAVRLALTTDKAEVQAGDALRADAFVGTLADVVICNPPFNERDWGHDELAADPRWEYGLPPRAESELAWIQHALAHVKQGGVVAVLMPVAAASRRSGRRIRSDLIRKGALRAVIGVPAAMASTAGIPAHLWLLRRPLPSDHAPSTVLFAEIEADRPDEVVTAWEQYQREPLVEPFVGQAVPVLDLLDDETDLTPSLHLVQGKTTPGDVMALTKEIEQRLSKVRRFLPSALDGPSSTTFSLTTVGDLVNAGVITVVRPGKSEEVLCAPGDLVVTPGGERFQVQVAAEPIPVTPPVQLVRVNRDVVDAQFLAGFLRSAHNHYPGTGTSSLGRRDIRRAVVPRPPALAEQRIYGMAFQRMEEVRAGLHEVADRGEFLARTLVDGLSEGHLTVPRDSSQA